MFGLGRKAHREISAADLARLIDAGAAVVVDVREADEFAAGRVPGAVNLPLSRFDPAAIPAADGRQVVLNCLGGKRSGMALDKCAAAQAVIDTHLAGGYNAWVEAGLPIES